MRPVVALLLTLAATRFGRPFGSPFGSPDSVIVVTSRGASVIPVSVERGAPAVAAVLLVEPLGMTVSVTGASATVLLGGTTFVFQLGAPFARAGQVVCALGGAPYVARDTLFLPLPWLAECLPRTLAPRYRWEARTGRLVVSAPPAVAILRPPNPMTGLRLRHTVVVDPGHGGPDPGNPGVYFPDRLTEKDITLAIGRLLRAELIRRGIDVVMTRSTDTLIDLGDRGAYCSNDCDLFVSVHVNSMPPGRRQSRASGVETYFLSDAKTEDAQRVAQFENSAIRFDTRPDSGLKAADYIMRDLAMNEYVRQSARLAELVQDSVRAVHPGGDRGVQQADFAVLRTARRPAILVETGFSTNRDDGAFLASSIGQHKIATAIAAGVVAYLLDFEHKLTVQGAGQ
jgi:N-acetylmuramoyl-L-alanine amidase